MKFIPIMEISSHIMTLIEEAVNELIIVSPYVSIKDWDKLKRCLNNAIARNVAVTFYVRDNTNQDLELLKKLKVKLVLIKDLHAKIYLNDTYAIVSSQNLYQYSDINSIDFGYTTETDEERNQLVKLIDKYLVNSISIEESISSKPTLDFLKPKKNETIENGASGKTILNNFEIKEIYKNFKDKSQNVRVNNDFTYVFCTRLFEYADVMFKEGYEIRFRHNWEDYNAIIKVIESLTFEQNHYRYTKKLTMKNNHPQSLIFVPQGYDNIENLISDYIFMTKNIQDETKSLCVNLKRL